MVMGTAGYMSPEQVRGQAVDHRTDIFAFGAILYEMLTGKRAFQRSTSAETMTAILNDDPPAISQTGANIPPALQRVVNRCLEKNPEQRFHSASDLAFALDTLSDSGPVPDPAPIGPAPKTKWSRIVVATLIVALLAGIFLWWRTPASVPQVTSVTQLTHDGVSKRGTTVAYDGSRAVFHGRRGFRLADCGGSGCRRGHRSACNHTAPPLAAGHSAPDFSGLLVTSHGFKPGPLWWQPLPVGTPRRLLGNLEAGRASLTPDGKHIVYSNGGTLAIAELDGSNQQDLASVDGRTGTLAISPDSQRIRFATWNNETDSRSLWELDIKSRSLRQLLVGWPGTPIASGRWTTDGRYFIFPGGDLGRFDLWAIPEKRGFWRRKAEPIRLTTGPLSFGFPALSRDGDKIYATGTTRRGELVRLDPHTAQWVPFLSGLPAIDTTFSRDGKWMAYISYPDHMLWRCRADGSDCQQITYPPLVLNDLGGISPDDSRVTFNATTPGSGTTLFSASLQDGQPRMLLHGETGGTWSLDGRALLINAVKNGLKNGIRDYELQEIDPSSGKISSFPDGQSKYGLGWSAQGVLVAIDDTLNLQIFDPRTQTWSELLKGPCATVKLSPDGSFAHCETSDVPNHKIIRVRLSDRRAETVMEIKGLRRVVDEYFGTLMDVAPDGSVLLMRDLGTEEIYALSVKWP